MHIIARNPPECVQIIVQIIVKLTAMSEFG